MLKDGGKTAGVFADAFAVSKPTMSAHFAKLNSAGLIQDESRRGSIIHTLNVSALEEFVLGFMTRMGVGEDKGAAMRSRPLIVVSLAIICLLAVIAIVALSRLPAGSQLPVHWNAAGEADRFADAGYALFMPVVMSTGLSALFAVLPRIEPLQDRMNGSAPLIDACRTGLLVLMVLVQPTVAAPSFGLALPPTLMLAGLGILLIAIGNALPKSRPGFFVGIRTPWALIDADNWIATHRLGSRTTMTGGAIIVAAAVLPIGAPLRAVAVCLALAVMVIPPVVYSWWLWRRNSARA